MSDSKPLPPGVVLQRDKETYAARITPPSGVLTADDLEKMAAVVRKYDIPAVKITSGQRIGFYGLTLDTVHAVCDDMPFRTGGHYVQACPGTDWCQFAHTDSIALANMIEDKFGFEPVPAKVKFGISGCNFSCAESYIRDIGFIGSSKGWTMIVGGNSGQKPRLGDVIATQLSTEKAFELTKAFLVFYCENAPQKQRTAHFIEKIGIETVKAELDLA